MMTNPLPPLGRAAGNGAATAKPDDRLVSDKRYKIIEATMRRYGYQGHGLIEALHSAQEAFGYLDDFTLMHIARTLHLPPSKVFGVATFYNLFTLKPQGAHTCVVCLGTACYIKGAREVLAAIEAEYDVKAGGTTRDNQLSLLTARCFGSCALAPVLTFDGETIGKVTPEAAAQQIAQRMMAIRQAA
ncbi:MAG: bidirectional hydrogenase complex protein HoxE [Thermoflexales bacterium]|nr:bidirectional hydrogenase complex protein HoxE [Thermoflexales bacterium]MDW8350745.1 bidirectional hydrogenase complex protein HoxE [Anaerolineae bacterium]